MNNSGRGRVEATNLEGVRSKLVRAVDVSGHVGHHERHGDQVDPANFGLRAQRVGPMIGIVIHAVEGALAERVVHGAAIDVVVVLGRAPALVLLQFRTRCVIIVIGFGSIARYFTKRVD